MFVEFLRTLAAALGYTFHYGRSDFQNLFSAIAEDDPNIYLFLDPIVRLPELSPSTGLRTGYTLIRGKMMLLSKSDLDEEYDAQTGNRPLDEGKWRKNIKPKVEAASGALLDRIACTEDQEIKKWTVMDVINMFDDNMDGVLIDFEIRWEG
jgi:hypothetical protein